MSSDIPNITATAALAAHDGAGNPISHDFLPGIEPITRLARLATAVGLVGNHAWAVIYNNVSATIIATMSNGPCCPRTTPGVIVELVDANSDVNLEQITLGVASPILNSPPSTIPTRHSLAVETQARYAKHGQTHLDPKTTERGPCVICGSEES